MCGGDNNNNNKNIIIIIADETIHREDVDAWMKTVTSYVRLFGCGLFYFALPFFTLFGRHKKFHFHPVARIKGITLVVVTWSNTHEIQDRDGSLAGCSDSLVL
jgi:hypothetical protein